MLAVWPAARCHSDAADPEVDWALSTVGCERSASTMSRRRSKLSRIDRRNLIGLTSPTTSTGWSDGRCGATGTVVGVLADCVLASALAASAGLAATTGFAVDAFGSPASRSALA